MNKRQESAGIDLLRQVIDEVAQGLPASAPAVLPRGRSGRWRWVAAALMLLALAGGGWWIVVRDPLSRGRDGSLSVRNVEVLSLKIRGREVRPRVIASRESGALLVTVERLDRQRVSKTQPLGWVGGKP